MKRFAIFIIFTLNTITPELLFSQITFQKTYDGGGSEAANSIIRTSDGGYMISGYVQSASTGKFDAYLLKTDQYGDSMWTRTYGGLLNDWARDVKQTTDGGYILTGFSQSFGDNVYVVKTNSLGDTLWTRSYGGIDSQEGESIQPTSDGGYIISGEDFDNTMKIFLIRTNANGDTLWTRKNDGVTTPDMRAYSIIETTDNGFALTGYNQGTATSNDDMYLVKLDMHGDTMWTRTFGGTGSDEGHCIRQTTDGGYIIAGTSNFSFGSFGADIYIAKINNSGDLQWSNRYDNLGDERSYSIEQTSERGYIIAGESENLSTNERDAFLLKIDSLGAVSWSKTYGGSGWDAARAALQSSDGGYIITGFSYSFSPGNFAIYMIKTDSFGNSGCYTSNAATIAYSVQSISGNCANLSSVGCTILSTSTVCNSGLQSSTICTNIDIRELEKELYITVSPNPFENELRITGTSIKGQITLFNLIGEEMIIQKTYEAESNLIVKNLISGFYLLKYVDSGKSIVIKLIKK